MARFLSALLPFAAISLACTGAFAQQYGYSNPPQPDPFLNQPDNNAPAYQPPVPAGEQAYGRVLSATPSYRQVSVPQQVCNDQQVYSGQRNSGVGAIAGAVIGGVLGNGVGHGFGRAAATGVGVVAGSAIGNQIEGGYPSYQTVRQCGTQYVTQNQPDGYNVEYEYAGRRYSTRTDSAPGEWLPLDIQPAANGYNNGYPQGNYADSYGNAPQPGVVVGSDMPQPVYSAAPVYAPAPVYYPTPIAVRPVIQIGVGGYWGGGHRHWR